MSATKNFRALALFGIATLATAVGLTASGEQPDKWVSYVESTDSAWVDTGVIGRPNTKIEAKVEWLSLFDSAFLASGDWENNTRFYMCYCLNANGETVLSQRNNTVVTLKIRMEYPI